MSATLMIFLGILGFTALFYLVGQMSNKRHSERQPQYPAPPLNGVLPTAMVYAPQPPAEEPPRPGISLWPIFLVLLIGGAVILYLSYQYQVIPPKDTSSGLFRDQTEAAPHSDALGEFEYDNPKQELYYDPGEKQPASTYEAPLSTPRIDTRKRERMPAEPYEQYVEKSPPASAIADTAPDYQKGYGVQLFATESSWLEEAHVQHIQQSYPGLSLLISTGYSSEQVKMNKFILGTFNTKAAADGYARRLGKEFPGAYVVDISKLERVGRYWAVP